MTTITEQPQTAKKPASKPSAKKTKQDNVQALIAERAYYIYEQRGCTHGDDQQDWLEAEKQIRQELGL